MQALRPVDASPCSHTHIFLNGLAHLLRPSVAFPFFICDLSFKKPQKYFPLIIPHHLNSPSPIWSLETDCKITLHEAVDSKITLWLFSQSLLRASAVGHSYGWQPRPKGNGVGNGRSPSTATEVEKGVVPSPHLMIHPKTARGVWTKPGFACPGAAGTVFCVGKEKGCSGQCLGQTGRAGKPWFSCWDSLKQEQHAPKNGEMKINK